MKTATITFLSVLLVCIFCLAIGCRQQTNDSVAVAPSGNPIEISDPPPASTESSSTATAETTNSDPPIAVAGASLPDKPSAASPQATNSSAQVADTEIGSQVLDPDQHIDEITPSDTEEEFDVNEFDVNDNKPAEPTIDIPGHWSRLGKAQEIWVDHKNKQVIVGGKVCLTAGPLEMLICPRRTKEHETIVSVNAESWQVHAALLAVGAEQGVPARWVPEYTPAWGPKIAVQMMWRDEETKQVKTIDGKQWILDSETQKPMTHELVFGGSYEEPLMDGGPRQYVANAGELICLANFSTSTIDLRILDQDAGLYFEANTSLIPPINTQIYTLIKPGPVVGKPEP